MKMCVVAKGNESQREREREKGKKKIKERKIIIQKKKI